MATRTPNLSLIKPGPDDAVDVADLNENFDKIDNFAGGVGGDTYTKSEIDEMLAEKVDKVTGKGLSTNDFTDEDKEQIATNKNNILYNIKDGVQNIFKLAAGTRTAGGVTFTINSDGAITLSNTATSDSVFIISDNLNVSDDTYVLYGDGFVSGIFMDTYEAGYTNRRTFTTYAVTNSNTKIWRLIVSSGTNVNGVTIRPMICLKSLYDANPSYQPYAMSNAELTAAIQALQAQLANQ